MAEPNRPRKLLLRPLFWVLVFGFLGLSGAYAWMHIPVEVLPRFDFPLIRVISHRPGATAAELETSIARPLEGQLLALPGVQSVRSIMGNGTVRTDVRFTNGSRVESDLQAVNGAIDRARERLPLAVHPLAEIMGNAINEVADYTAKIPPQVSPAAVQRAVRARVVPALRALPGVQRVEVYGMGRESLWVQPDLQALRRYRVPVTALDEALRRAVLLKPGGYLSAGHRHVLIEVRNLPLSIRALGELPVTSPSGPIPLAALARIVRAPLPAQNAVLLDGRPSVAITVLKQPGASTLPVTRAVQATLDQTLNQLPHGVRWIRAYSQGHIVHLIGADLGRNLLIGALLAIAVLFWILGAGRGIWMLALSIPLSLLIAVAGLFFTGQSLNLMTLGALSVAVGLLADDAIIVLESIYHRWERGESRWDGIRNGLRDIAGPDLTGTLTTVVVFVPLLFVGGLAGLFFLPFALAMGFALLASLAISLSLIPLGLGFVRAAPRTRPSAATRLLETLYRLNRKLFALAAGFPRTALLACVGLLFASLAGLVLVAVNFLSLPNEGVLLESFTLSPGTAFADTEAVVNRITRRLQADPLVAHTYARIGSAVNTGYTEPASAGEIMIVLKPGVDVNSLDRIGRRLLHESRSPGVQLALDTPTVERVGESLSGLPQPFVLRLYGNRIGELRELSVKITNRLRRVPALADIFNNDAYPVTQIRIKPKPSALGIYGLSAAGLYAQLKPLLQGEIVASVPDGALPLAIYTRLADAPARSLRQLGSIPIETRDGWTPLGQLARLRWVSTPNQIRHIDGTRAVDILATPRGSLGSAISSARRALAGLSLPPGYRIGFGGLYPELEQAAIGLGLAGIVALVLMVGILVLQFDGLLVPGLLLLQIPLAFTGGALALLLSGVGLNLGGLVAFLTLVGISLNHGIVLLHRIRRNERGGMPLREAITEAIQVRFRPILLTTLTAVLGMLPTALGWGQGAAPEQGLAVVILGGILWSALLTTNLIPALYLHWHPRSIAPEAAFR